MVRIDVNRVLIASWGFAIALGLTGAAIGEDFRVENAVYQGDQKKPSSESTTIFHNGVVYDCMKTPAETVVFDKTADHFILLDLNRRTRAELTTAQLAALTDQLQLMAVKSKDPVVRFLAKPHFQERSEEAAGVLTLAGPLVMYRLMLSPETNQDIVNQYHEFCDYYARLNALLSPGSRPPFGRLVVNAALAQRQATASEVQLTILSGTETDQQQTNVRSEHRVICPLAPADLDRVKEIRAQMSQFKLVSFNQYRKTFLR